MQVWRSSPCDVTKGNRKWTALSPIHTPMRGWCHARCCHPTGSKHLQAGFRLHPLWPPRFHPLPDMASVLFFFLMGVANRRLNNNSFLVCMCVLACHCSHGVWMIYVLKMSIHVEPEKMLSAGNVFTFITQFTYFVLYCVSCGQQGNNAKHFLQRSTLSSLMRIPVRKITNTRPHLRKHCSWGDAQATGSLSCSTETLEAVIKF